MPYHNHHQDPATREILFRHKWHLPTCPSLEEDEDEGGYPPCTCGEEEPEDDEDSEDNDPQARVDAINATYPSLCCKLEEIVK